MFSLKTLQLGGIRTQDFGPEVDVTAPRRQGDFFYYRSVPSPD
jgi:hypothetical protein